MNRSHQSSQHTKGNGISNSQLQLYNIMRRLWVEHVMWTRSFIISTAFNLGDLDAVTQRLLRNPKDFAAVLKPFYGERIADKFEDLLTQHLLIAAQLVNAAKAGNASMVEEQRKKWYANGNEIVEFLSDINPYWNDSVWQKLFNEHLEMTENEAVQILSGKYADSIVQYDAIQNEALLMADVMADGIIKQFRV